MHPKSLGWNLRLYVDWIDRQMMRDERHYPDSNTFIPERHFVRQTSADHVKALSECNADDPRSLVFGFGRRWAIYTIVRGPELIELICPSQNLSRTLPCRCDHLALARVHSCNFWYATTHRPCYWQRIPSTRGICPWPNEVCLQLYASASRGELSVIELIFLLRRIANRDHSGVALFRGATNMHH